MADTLTLTVNGCTVTAHPQPSGSSRWGYEVDSPDGTSFYVSPYRWSSPGAALEAGRQDAEEYEPPAPRRGRPPVAEDARVVDVTLPADLIERIDASRGPVSRAAAIRDVLLAAWPANGSQRVTSASVPD